MSRCRAAPTLKRPRERALLREAGQEGDFRQRIVRFSQQSFGELAPGFTLHGNHEYALLNSAEDFNPRARADIEWTREALSDPEDREGSYAGWDFLADLVPSHDDGTAMFAHGSPRDPVREYLLPGDAADAAKMRANFAIARRSGCPGRTASCPDRVLRPSWRAFGSDQKARQLEDRASAGPVRGGVA